MFDFDGVLVLSNAVKQDAYREIFSQFGVTASAISECQRANPEGNRIDVIREVLRRLQTTGFIRSDEAIDAHVTAFATAYNDICEEYAATCPEVGGATQCLSEWARRFPLYINSATLEEPLQRIIGRRGWAAHFRKALGSPARKTENLKAILTREQVEPSSMLFVGDGKRDLDAAVAVGCRFVGVRNEFNDFDPVGVTLVADMNELDALLTGGSRD